MKIEVQCIICNTPHFDHYECSRCHHNVDSYGSFWTKEQEQELIKNKWLYCPWCGESLEESEEKIAPCGHPERFWKVEPDNSTAWCLQCAIDKLSEELAYIKSDFHKIKR